MMIEIGGEEARSGWHIDWCKRTVVLPQAHWALTERRGREKAKSPTLAPSQSHSRSHSTGYRLLSSQSGHPGTCRLVLRLCGRNPCLGAQTFRQGKRSPGCAFLLPAQMTASLGGMLGGTESRLGYLPNEAAQVSWHDWLSTGYTIHSLITRI